MDFLATSEGQLLVGVAVGLVAIGAAYFLFSSKKPKGLMAVLVTQILFNLRFISLCGCVL